MNYMLMPLRRYADFNGRSRRKEYWLWQLFNLIIFSLLVIPLIASFFSAMSRVNERGGVTRADSYSSSYESGSDSTSSTDSDSAFSYESGASYSAKYDVDPFMLMDELGTLPWILIGLLSLWSLVIFIPTLAVTIRRLHDQDKSGWMYLLVFVPIVGAIIVLVFMFLEGTRGPNRFGEDPKGPDVGRTFG